MDDEVGSGKASADRCTTVERTSERELVITRTFAAPATRVFEAWTTPERLKRWWAPVSYGIAFVSCEADVRTGGGYRFVFSHPAAEQPMAFFGRYLEATPPSRLVWTNEEGGADGPITTVTFEDKGAETLVIMQELHPTKEALDVAVASDSACGFSETFAQLDELLTTLGVYAAG